MMNCIYIIIFVIILFYLIFLYEDFDCIINTCESDYILKDNNCVKNIICPVGQYNNKGNCTDCKPVTNVFDKNSYDINCKVTKCASKYYLNDNDNTCTSTCATGYILDGDYCFINKICSINQVAINNICTPYKTEYNFTNCGSTGRLGPTLEQCNTFYSSTNLNNKIEMDIDRQGIQIWKVPQTGKYLIKVAGAGLNVGRNCKGVIISSVFTLNIDEKIKILVGQSGVINNIKIGSTSGSIYDGIDNIIQENNHKRYSGSGGTFVVKCKGNIIDNTIENNIPLIIAGGGGGINQEIINKNTYYNTTLGSFSNDGQYSEYNKFSGGINGYSKKIVDKNDIMSSDIGTAGSFYDNGYSYIIKNTTNLLHGYSFLNGGMGGIKIPNNNFSSEGGFGCSSASVIFFCGSGGGYSGGSYGKYDTGSGGGSYCLNLMEKLGYNNGMGYVNIKFLGES